MVPVIFLTGTAAERCSGDQMTSLFNDTNIYALAKMEQHGVLNCTFVQSVYWHRMLEKLIATESSLLRFYTVLTSK
jgi:hypothetical protein